MEKAMNKEYYDYLINLRDSGEVNMWGAAPYLVAEFGLTRREARTVLLEWIQTFTSDSNANTPS